MRVKVLAAVMLTGSAIAALAAAFIFSCCVLPFHREIHSVVPLCHVAKAMTSDAGQPSDDPGRPAEKQRDDHRSLTRSTLSSGIPDVSAVNVSGLRGSASRRAYRSLGAMRCDSDVGLPTLLAVFRI